MMKLRGLRQMRQRRGISIGQLADVTGLRRETIAHLEHGQEDPQPYALRRLEAALGASAAELYAGPRVQETPPPAEHLPGEAADVYARHSVAVR
jgi:transcriptional regulator with XRE-family HTH domain